LWVNRESFTRPTSWHGRPARVKARWLAILFECMGRNSALQARRADIEMAVARAIVVDRREFLFSKPRGLAAPADIMPSLRGWCFG
jgi:hypothetical protein